MQYLTRKNTNVGYTSKFIFDGFLFGITFNVQSITLAHVVPIPVASPVVILPIIILASSDKLFFLV